MNKPITKQISTQRFLVKAHRCIDKMRIHFVFQFLSLVTLAQFGKLFQLILGDLEGVLSKVSLIPGC